MKFNRQRSHINGYRIDADRIRGDHGPIPFPRDRSVHGSSNRDKSNDLAMRHGSVDDVLAVFDSMSRRITDLARELNCLGHFDDPNADRPRAA